MRERFRALVEAYRRRKKRRHWDRLSPGAQMVIRYVAPDSVPRERDEDAVVPSGKG